MAHTTIETIGFCEGVIELLAQNRNELAERGVNIDGWHARLRSVTTNALKVNAEQQAQKARMREMTAMSVAALDGAYVEASSMLNAVMGTLGNRNEASIQASRLRSAVNRRAKKARGDADTA
ncbi:MAG: hypothetical protein HZC28_16980 [Spirochaetes bacterium]|nr:hypothetical protein [Spirochaetota bacterium]